MKKQKQTRGIKSATTPTTVVQDQEWTWWLWATALAGLIAVFQVYAPALNGAFVLDDRALPFMSPNAANMSLWAWIRGLRPLLYFTFWMNYSMVGTDPFLYHATNVLLHFLASAMITLVVAKLVEWAGVTGLQKIVLAVFSGGLFLLHPLQTESVAYVASRSENLSVLCYFASFAVFLYRPTESITLPRSLAVIALFGAALATKEHTMTLPLLLLLTDYFWGRGSIRKNSMLYGLLALAAAIGARAVWRVLRSANTVGFGLKDLSPSTYLFTQGRVIWTYVRLFFLPFGQNLDPDVALSTSPLDHGAIFGLAGLVVALAAAWFCRKRWPLAAFGVIVFLLLLAPTSSIVPIRDVLAERRLYLPFLGLALVCVELLRHVRVREATWIGLTLLAICCGLTYRRNQVWASPLTLWEDTVAKSPEKYRPRFQLAYALYQETRCFEASQSYALASRLGPQGEELLVDWALALDCAARSNEAIARLQQAILSPSLRTAPIFATLGMIYAKQNQPEAALQALAQAERANPRFEMTHVYRGNLYAIYGDRTAAVTEYERALAINPSNQAASSALARIRR